jgi:hypothetical protein
MSKVYLYRSINVKYNFIYKIWLINFSCYADDYYVFQLKMIL